uniref:aromatic-ring hydroxylase C-terminal domain-containing protein n=1 Tax=Paractinoplanes polyasparticus TaxID=2856853 RepID=UPI0034DB5AE9
MRAGDRAPDATGLTTAHGELGLFDLTRGTHFTLLSFGTAPAVDVAPYDVRILHVGARPTGPDDIADTGDRLADAYGATGTTLVLIRPDGYIAMISDAGDVPAVRRYLSAIG